MKYDNLFGFKFLEPTRIVIVPPTKVVTKLKWYQRIFRPFTESFVTYVEVIEDNHYINDVANNIMYVNARTAVEYRKSLSNTKGIRND